MASATDRVQVPTGARVPDFFIVGHMKCGTTALYELLRQHPQIFMPDVKEPRYFAQDLLSPLRPDEPKRTPHRYRLDAYLELFSAAGAEQRAGEASPNYLRSEEAAVRIAEVQPQARIIAVFREPVSFLRSLHLQSVHNGIEPETSFEKAIALEDERREGRSIPPGCTAPETLLYSQHVRYTHQLAAFEGVFPRENILVLIYDDFRRDNDAAVREVLRFLDVDDGVELAAVETEPLGQVRSQRLLELRRAVWAAKRGLPAGRGARLLSAVVPESLSGVALGAYRRLALEQSAPVDEDLALALRRRFKPEVVALGEHIGRDLTALWGYDKIG